ncbi:MAG: UDP-4-amino-4,6-dideoxy-N-acetyl-beta-L-altrosamine transaminase [Acidobacteriota bacterium]
MKERLAIDGGSPVRKKVLPYGRQSIEEEDLRAVVEVLRSDWLTTGPAVSEFERAFADYVGAREAVAVANGTAALHAAVYALGIGPGDEVICPAMTFAASANCVVYQGGEPVFVDVEEETLLIDASKAEAKITPRTKAIIAVDYAGQPCDYDALRCVAERHSIAVLSDACHALGGKYRDRNVGGLGRLSAFSLHPVKHITTGEGGMITTDDEELARRCRVFRNHGITSDHRQREAAGSWFYEMIDLGFNYRLTDFQCALGLSQLRRLDRWIERRQQIARRYDRAFAGMEAVSPLRVRRDVSHAYHLYVIRVNPEFLSADRSRIFAALRAEGIGVNVHYVPVHLHPFYRERFATASGMCPAAEAAYERIISLPIFPAMTDADADDVIAAVCKVVRAYSK